MDADGHPSTRNQRKDAKTQRRKACPSDPAKRCSVGGARSTRPTRYEMPSPCHSDRASVANEWRNLWGGCWKIVATLWGFSSDFEVGRASMRFPRGARHTDSRRVGMPGTSAERGPPAQRPLLATGWAGTQYPKLKINPWMGGRVALSTSICVICGSSFGWAGTKNSKLKIDPWAGGNSEFRIPNSEFPIPNFQSRVLFLVSC
jgi:hypothetical protein